MKLSREEAILEKYGAKNIEGYCLVSNHGYTFEIEGDRYDARFWANCYGVEVNEWDIHSRPENLFTEERKALLKKIKKELNGGR